MAKSPQLTDYNGSEAASCCSRRLKNGCMVALPAHITASSSCLKWSDSIGNYKHGWRVVWWV